MFKICHPKRFSCFIVIKRYLNIEVVRMAKRPSFRHQINERLNELDRLGQSRHAEKKIQKELTGSKYVPTIHSISTKDAYRDSVMAFTAWARDNYGVKTLEDAKQYAPQYLEHGINQKWSPYTLQAIRSAMHKVYDRSVANQVIIPIRHKDQIERSRGEKPSDKHFSEKNNQAIVDFNRGCGLRRMELEVITPKDIYKDPEGRVMGHVESGKGGQSREFHVLQSKAELVWQLKESAIDQDKPIFDHVPVHMDCHSYRRGYAQQRYVEQHGSQYISGRPDHAALDMVSEDLGHHREDVIVNHYL